MLCPAGKRLFEFSNDRLRLLAFCRHDNLEGLKRHRPFVFQIDGRRRFWFRRRLRFGRGGRGSAANGDKSRYRRAQCHYIPFPCGELSLIRGVRQAAQRKPRSHRSLAFVAALRKATQPSDAKSALVL